MNTVKFHIIVCATSLLALIALPSCKNHRDSSKNNSQSFLDSAVFENVDSIANLEEVDFNERYFTIFEDKDDDMIEIMDEIIEKIEDMN